MAFSPSSRVYLLDTPLDNTYKNELYFENATAQFNYFSSKIKHQFDSVTYQRKDGILTVSKHIDELWNVNYVMYQNANFTNKWFYAFITKMEWASDHATHIYIETDVYQSWLFDTELKESFVVREHVSDDTIGKHLVDEGLETGEYIMEHYEASGALGDNMNILAVSDNSPLGNTDPIGNKYGNVVTGLTYFPFPNSDSGITWLKNTIKLYTDAGKADAIVMIFTVPKFVIDSWEGTTGFPITSGSPYGFKIVTVDSPSSSFNGFTPKNNKLLAYPYKFLYASNNTGGSANYRYEDFETRNNIQFALYGSVSPDPTIMLCPQSYKGTTFSYEHGLTLKGFPMCSWNTDTYNAWFAQNSGSMAINMVGSLGAIGAGVATGNVLAVGGGALGVASQMTQFYKASIQPDQAKGQIGAGTLQFATNSLDYYFAQYTIKQEFAKRIDAYFTMYGYKVNALKVPETHSRQRWNYIQTIDVNIEGSIPADDMAKLKSIYDKGITLWHNPSDIMRYDLSNPII